MRRQLRAEEVMTIEVLARRGVAKRAIARQLGVSEGAVRYQLAKAAEEKADGRAGKPLLADEFEEKIQAWIDGQDSTRPTNCRALHEYLVEEHKYPHGYRTVLRWVRRHYGRPKTRTWRRVETPPGAQVQTDWGEFPRVVLGGEERQLHAFVMVLSHSRRVAVVWSLRENQLSWLHCHNEAFRRLGGVAAVNRIDNLKTGISQGAGAWGTVNPTYRSYADTVGFHVDACAPRRGDHKGKVEAKVRLTRLRSAPRKRPYECLEELQEETDASLDRWSRTAKCPVTGETVYDTWRKEQELLRPLGSLPEPFDVVVMRRVHRDCLVHFEGGQYTVPFRFVERQVEVRGCAGKVQIVGEGKVLCEYPRGERRLHIDASCYEGPATERVLPPTPLGRMGQRLQEIVEQPVYQLLIIDEMGFTPLDRDEAGLLFRLVSYRYEKGATIITTNKSIKDWPEILAGDEARISGAPGPAAAPKPRLQRAGPVLPAQGPGEAAQEGLKYLGGGDGLKRSVSLRSRSNRLTPPPPPRKGPCKAGRNFPPSSRGPETTSALHGGGRSPTTGGA